jgi:predicted membrane channel-forming protein YqfA (hemolysin III family)
MTPDLLFQRCNQFVMIAWLALILVPHVRGTLRLISMLWISLLALLYTVLILLYWGKTPGGFTTLSEVAQLFKNPWFLLAGWVHYLAFDLFVGCWEVRDSQQQGIPHWMVIPCLILTFLFGPIGWLSYFVVRTLKSKDWKVSALKDDAKIQVLESQHEK